MTDKWREKIDGWFAELERLSDEYMKIREMPTIRAFLEDIKNIPPTSKDSYYYEDDVLRDLMILEGLRIEIGRDRESISVPYPMGEEEKEWSKKLSKICNDVGDFIWYLGEEKLKREAVEYLKKKIKEGSVALKTMTKEILIPSAVASLHTLVRGGGNILMEKGTPVLMWGEGGGGKLGMFIVFLANGGTCLQQDANSVVEGIITLADLVGGEEYSKEITNRIFEVYDRMMKLKEEADKLKEEVNDIEDVFLRTLEKRKIITSVNEERERHTILPYRISILTDRAKNLLRSGNFEVLRIRQLLPMFGNDEMLPEALYKLKQIQNDGSVTNLTLIKTECAPLMDLLKNVGIVMRDRNGYLLHIMLQRDIHSAIVETFSNLTDEKLVNMLKDGFREWEGDSTFRKEMSNEDIMEIYRSMKHVEITGVIWDKNRIIFKSLYERGMDDGVEIGNVWLWKTISSMNEGKKRLKAEIISADTMHSLGVCYEDCTIEDGMMLVNERIKNSTVIGILQKDMEGDMIIYHNEGSKWILAGRKEITKKRPPAMVFYENVERKIVGMIEEKVKIQDYYIGEVSDEELGSLAEYILPQYRTRRLFEQLRKIKGLDMMIGEVKEYGEPEI